jgi:REP element-mobilizing transposase RayT
MKKERIPLLPDHTYHIYNRGVGEEKLFLTDRNYNFFLEKLNKYILNVADIYCYCLMPNHFHLLLKIKNEASLEDNIKGEIQGKLHVKISQQFSNCFNAYSKAFNKARNRRGSLFMKPFKRKPVDTEQYLKKIVHYIHLNPVKAKLVEYPHQWNYSSYNAITSQSKTKVKKDEVISWFDDLENFRFYHLSSGSGTGIDL